MFYGCDNYTLKAVAFLFENCGISELKTGFKNVQSGGFSLHLSELIFLSQNRF
jgi:hypothetical protein